MSPPTCISTLSLHDALPISLSPRRVRPHAAPQSRARGLSRRPRDQFRWRVVAVTSKTCRQVADKRFRRASEFSKRSEEHRLNSSHLGISYAVFCLKKKKNKQ